MKRTIYINGRFLTQQTTGVQRVAREMVKMIDDLYSSWKEKAEFYLLTPDYSPTQKLELKHVKEINLGGKGGYWWEQVTLPRYIHRQKREDYYLFGACNLAPLSLKSRNAYYLHDIAFITHPEFYSKAFVFAYKFFEKRLVKKAGILFTGTNAAKKEIATYYKRAEQSIVVLPHGVSTEFRRVEEPSESAKAFVASHPNFYFSVGSKSPNKNMRYVFACAEKHPEKTFAISGASNRTFNEGGQENIPQNVIHLGYLSDADLRLFYSHCEALIFPSLYEGFGLPPIEAVYCGCRNLIVSDLPVLREVLGDCANYIDPLDYEKPLLPTKRLSEQDATSLIERYQWEKTATTCLEALLK